MSDLIERLRGPIGPFIYDHPNGIPLTIEAADEIQRLRADKEKLRSFLERGGIDSSSVLCSEDDGTWEDENERLQQLAHELRDWFRAYPEDVFTPLQGDPIKKTGDYDTKEKRTLITRASAAMARHMIERIPEKIRAALDEAHDD